MAKLSHREIDIIKTFVDWPRGGGRVLDYDHGSFCEMFWSEFNFNMSAFRDEFIGPINTDSKLLISFCQQAPLPLVIKVLKYLLDEKYYLDSKGAFTSTGTVVDNFENLIERLEKEATSDAPDTTLFETETADQDLNSLKQTIRDFLKNNEPEEAVDRLHVYCVKKIKHLLTENEVEYEDNDKLTYLFGKYQSDLNSRHPLLPMSQKIMRSIGSIFEQFNETRNKSSRSHDNELPPSNEAEFIVKTVIAILFFIKSIEGDKWGD